MTYRPSVLALISISAFAATSCGAQATGETSAEARSTQAPSTAAAVSTARDFSTKEHGTFDEAWAAAFVPGTEYLAITERGGKIKLRWPDGTIRVVSGAPTVDYGGQGGLGPARADGQRDVGDADGILEGTAAAVGERDVDHGSWRKSRAIKKGARRPRGCEAWPCVYGVGVVLMSHARRRFPGATFSAG